MSIEQLRDFLVRMQADGALKQQVLAAATADDVAQIALQHATNVNAVLNQHRPVQAVFLEQNGMTRRIDTALASERLNRIAWHQPYQEECHQRHADEGRYDQTDAG